MGQDLVCVMYLEMSFYKVYNSNVLLQSLPGFNTTQQYMGEDTVLSAFTYISYIQLCRKMLSAD